MKRSSWVVCVTLAIAVTLVMNSVTVAASSSGAHGTSAICSDDAGSELPELTVYIVDRVRLAENTRAEMLREAFHPWISAGVRMRWASDGADTAAGAAPPRNRVYVVVSDQPQESATKAGMSTRPALASATFVDGRPTNQIRVYASEVNRLLAGQRFGDRWLIDRPRSLRERLMGRVLGRVVAHELGHVLFASTGHASFGLMRALHTIELLTASSRRPFEVVPPQGGCEGARGERP